MGFIYARPFPFAMTPMANVSAFTYADGATYTRTLEEIIAFINNTLVPDFNTAIDAAISEYQGGINNAEQTVLDAKADWETKWTAFMADVNASLTGLNDTNLASLINDPESQGGAAVRTLINIMAISADELDGETAVHIGTANSETRIALDQLLNPKLDESEAAADYLKKVDAGTTYQTKADGQTKAEGLSKVDAAALYPTKQRLIDSLAPDRRGGNQNGRVVAFLGDSYMSGVGPTSQALRWTTRYATNAGVTENNQAVSGAGYTNQGVSGTGKVSNQAALIPLNTSRVIICAGINDTAAAAATVTSGVTDAITAVRARIPGVEIVVISPMWWNAQPTDAVRSVERLIRNALPADVRYVEGGLWIRQNRPDMQTGDGHPHDLGSLQIARWVEAKLDNTGPGGAVEGSFDRTAINEDEAITSSAGTGTGLTGGTIYDARPGKWRLKFDLAAYGTSDGNLWISIAGQQLLQRWGINTAGTYPRTAPYQIDVRHPGGDLVIEGGMKMNAPINVLKTGTRIKATWITD